MKRRYEFRYNTVLGDLEYRQRDSIHFYLSLIHIFRWHQLDKLDSTKYPNTMLGANVSNVPDCEEATKNGYDMALFRTFFQSQQPHHSG